MTIYSKELVKYSLKITSQAIIEHYGELKYPNEFLDSNLNYYYSFSIEMLGCPNGHINASFEKLYFPFQINFFIYKNKIVLYAKNVP